MVNRLFLKLMRRSDRRLPRRLLIRGVPALELRAIVIRTESISNGSEFLHDAVVQCITDRYGCVDDWVLQRKYRIDTKQFREQVFITEGTEEQEKRGFITTLVKWLQGKVSCKSFTLYKHA